MASIEPTQPVLCLMGPTAAGKTGIALELARHHNFEIISVDSALVYRGLDIGSGKPDQETLRELPHHLVDIRDPAQPYSAAEFREDAIRLSLDITSRGKRPLLVGGTMLYFKVLRDGLASMPSADPEIRQQILDMAQGQGWQAVHDRLAEVDPESAERIHPNDPQRLQRALEIYESTGITMTEHHRQEQEAQQALPQALSNLLFVALHPAERATLHQQIENRFHQMLGAGFVDEVKVLFKRGDLDPELPAIRSVGYRQIWDYLDGQYDYDTMVAKAITATRQLAKRQLTWLRGWPELHRLETEMVSESVNIVNKCLKLHKEATIRSRTDG
ncbi:MAG: tRNA (adenosine(37)-N6)-dimethylallyltransferase MiaA [Gammaproteobacteria bacterium]